MTQELAVRQSLLPRSAAMTLDEKIRYSQALSDAGLLPASYRGKPANVLYALEYAQALGVEPINAITSIHVIEGKPTASADLMAVLVRRAGHKLRIKGDDTFAEATVIRADDPDFPFESRWDMAKAERAGLTGKDVWKKYPGSMLRARAISEACRAGASEALFGVIYTPEELGAEVDGEGNVVRVESARADAATPPAQPSRPAAPSAPPAAPPQPAADQADATGNDCEQWQARIAAEQTLDGMRAMWVEAGPARDRDCGGKLLSVRMIERMTELRDAEQAAAAAAAAAENAHDREDEDAPVDVPEGVGEPVQRVVATRTDAGQAPVEGEVLPPAAAPVITPEPDSDDLRRETPQRRAVVTGLIEAFGGREIMEAAAEQTFDGLAYTDVATRRLREWLTAIQRDNATGAQS